MKKNIVALSALLLLMCASLSFAQTDVNPDGYDENGFLIVDRPVGTVTEDESDSDEFGPASQQAANDQTSYKQGEVASCFDYYTFGAVGINLTQDQSSYGAGDIVQLSGKIENNNPYPLVGLDIKARLVKNIPAPVSMRAEVMVLDEFDVAENININADGEFEVSYSHILPLNAPSGEYQIYFYAVEQDRFNMSGLSFTNDVVGSRLSFEVSGNTPEHVYLDQTNIVVGGQNHNTMGFVTQHARETEIPVTIPIYNPTDESKSMFITYDLYSWDSANIDNKISTRTEEITVAANSEEIITYTITNLGEPVYYLSISAEPTDRSKDVSVHSEKTISNIRLIVQDTDKTRINFIGTDVYPLTKGQDATLVTCFHNTNNGMSENISKIETVLRDSDGNEITRSVYEGTVSSQISAIARTINPTKNMANYSIETLVYNSSGDVVDSVEKNYSCEDINPGLCPNDSGLATMVKAIMAAILVILLLIIIYGFKRRAHNSNNI